MRTGAAGFSGDDGPRLFLSADLKFCYPVLRDAMRLPNSRSLWEL